MPCYDTHHSKRRLDDDEPTYDDAPEHTVAKKMRAHPDLVLDTLTHEMMTAPSGMDVDMSHPHDELESLGHLQHADEYAAGGGGGAPRMIHQLSGNSLSSSFSSMPCTPSSECPSFSPNAFASTSSPPLNGYVATAPVPSASNPGSTTPSPYPSLSNPSSFSDQHHGLLSIYNHPQSPKDEVEEATLFANYLAHHGGLIKREGLMMIKRPGGGEGESLGRGGACDGVVRTIDVPLAFQAPASSILAVSTSHGLMEM